MLDYRIGFYLYTLSYLLCNKIEFDEAVKLLPQGPAINVTHKNDLDSCGFLGAVIIAKDFGRDLKLEILNYLLFNIGVEPKRKDLNLAYLDLWEHTQEEWKIQKLLFRLHEKEINGKKCCLLPRDIIKIIWQFIRRATAEPLIPRRFFKNGIVKYQPIEEQHEKDTVECAVSR